jgi:hypothetical protein
MKLRFVIPAFAALLLVGSLANAAPAPNLAALSSTQAPADCEPALSFTNPNATERTSYDYPICGACSVTVCQGMEEETLCGYRNGEFLYCRPTGPLCQDGGPPYADFRCTCTSGIIP